MEPSKILQRTKIISIKHLNFFKNQKKEKWFGKYLIKLMQIYSGFVINLHLFKIFPSPA